LYMVTKICILQFISYLANPPPPIEMTVSKVTRRSGFTLIELLTVMAIIGILAAILIPAIGRVRHSAKTSQCASNLRQLGAAMQMFANENRGRMPQANVKFTDPETGSDETLRWYRVLSIKEYISRDEQAQLNNCPNADVEPSLWTTCYGMNGQLQIDSDEATSKSDTYWYPSRVVNPVNTIMLGDVKINPAWGNGGGGDIINFPGSDGGEYNQPDFRGVGNTCNILFVDGHVEALALNDFTKEMFKPSSYNRN